MSQSIQHIRNTILSRLREPFQIRIGVEVENLIYRSDLTRLPVNPGGYLSAVELRNILETVCAEAEISPSLTMEPGGQIEFGGSPFYNLHEVNTEWQKYLALLLDVCHDKDLILLDFALDPLYEPDDITIVDETKYNLMHDRFGTTGSLGKWMMKMSTSVQLNLDYSSKEGCAKLAFLSDALQPFLSLIFANVPFIKGEPAGTRNVRLDIWEDTDPSRCGGLLAHDITSEVALLTAFAKLTAEAPAIFGKNSSGNVGQFDGTIGDWLESISTSRELQKKDGLTALHQIFTHVRFKDVLEIRTPDRPPFGYELAPAAFITGLLQEPCSLDEVGEMVATWTLEERLKAVEKSKTLDLSQTAFSGKSFRDWTERLFELSMKGLDKRAVQSNIPSERIYLEPFVEQFLARGPFSVQIQEEFVTSGKTLKNFIHGRWQEQKEELTMNN